MSAHVKIQQRPAVRFLSSRRMFQLITLLAALSCGCDDKSGVTDDDQSDGGADSGDRDGGADSGQDAGQDAGTTLPGPVVTEPLAVDEWKTAIVFSNIGDPILAALETEEFLFPPDDQFLDVSWETAVTGENFAVGAEYGPFVYAAALVIVPEGNRAFARGDAVLTFFANNAARHPGDIYRSGRMRVPLGMPAGENLLVARIYATGNPGEIELWSTNAEIVFNTEDMTAPDLVVGQNDEQYLGVSVLHLGESRAVNVSAKVAESDHFESSEVVYNALAPDAVTQLSFLLKPTAAFAEAETEIPVTLRLESESFVRSYEAEINLTTVPADIKYRRTRRSLVDDSTQYYAVLPPSGASQNDEYGLILSLHGAAVEATGQAGSYSPKDWAYLIAPTNRRPYGFDWEEWGRLDAVEALDDAMETLPIDPRRVHLTGHSMGGHGAWHVGVHFAGRFGVIGPSAGWISFDSYGGDEVPDGPVGRARAASQTLEYVENFAASSVYIIHGSADDNVPVNQAEQMYEALQGIASELEYHVEDGAGHWWDANQDEPGADCVDWEPMIRVMRDRRVDPTPLSFRFKSPGPWINPSHSFITIRSATSPMLDCVVESTVADDVVTVVTTNVRSTVIDGAALASLGVTSVVVDGETHGVTGAEMSIGPQTGKNPTQYGPLNQLWHRPFCYVYDENGPEIYRHLAAYMLSYWSIIGNGHGCALGLTDLTQEIAWSNNLIYLGVLPALIEGGEDLPIQWDEASISIAGQQVATSAVGFVYPSSDRLNGYFFAAAGYEYLLYRYVPFSSRSGMPDFMIWNDLGGLANGFFDAEWQLDTELAVGL